MMNNVFARLLLLCVCLMAGVSTHAQIITTYAGKDTSGYDGDTGPATNAILRAPRGVVVDSKGNVYFSDIQNNCIRKVSTSGYITTIAGQPNPGYAGNGVPATVAYLNSPTSMGIDANDNIYFVDYGNNVIRMIDKADSIHTVAGIPSAIGFTGDGGPATLARLNHPFIAVDPAGNIYISDANNHRIRKVNTAGIINTIAGTGIAGYTGNGGPAISASMNPNGIGVSPEGEIYFVDAVSSVYRVIRKINTSGVISEYLNKWAEEFAFDGWGNVYFTDISCYVRRVTPSGQVYLYAGNGLCSYSGDDSVATKASMNRPVGMAFDSALNLYVCEMNGSRVRKITYLPTGIEEATANTGSINIFPNPVSGTFTVQLPSLQDKATIIIADMLGKTVATKTVDATNGAQQQFDAANLAPGLYLVNVSAGDQVYHGKLTVR